MKSVRELRESWWRFWPHFRSAVVETAKLIGPSARLLTTTEAHTYAYSVSANFLLASLPFLFLLLWVANQLLPSLGTTQQHVIGQLVVSYLPAGQDRLVADATRLAHRHTVQVFSFVMLAISSSGVFLPLEVALNSIWGFKRNRGYVRNQVVSLGLVLGCGAIAYSSVVLASLGNALAVTLFPAGWTVAIAGLSWLFLNLSSVPAAVAVFFLIYWLLPNGKVPAAQVLPAAIYAGLLAEVFKTVFPWLLPFLDFTTVYATLALPVTLLVWGYCGALLLLFGASLSARGVARLPSLSARLGRVAKSAHSG